MTPNEIVTCRAHSHAVRSVAFAIGCLFVSNGVLLAVAGYAMVRFAYDAFSVIAIAVFALAILLAFIPVWRIPLADRRTLSAAVARCPKCKIIPKT